MLTQEEEDDPLNAFDEAEKHEGVTITDEAKQIAREDNERPAEVVDPPTQSG